jgi:CXCXC repeat
MLEMALTLPACYQCNRVIEEGTPKVDLFCSHSFHTYCYCEMTWNENTCKCGVKVMSREMEETFRQNAAAKEDANVADWSGKLKKTDGFMKDLRELKKNVARARKARKAFFAMCRVRRAAFIEETRPFVTRIHELQKESVKGVRAAPESKAAQKEYLSIRHTLRMMERKYPQFSPHKGLFNQLKLPTPWEVRYSMRAMKWKVRWFFRTLPRLW